MKLSVSVSKRLCKEAGAAAQALGVSRNKLIQTALKEFLERRRDEILTKSINRCIDKYGNDLSEEEEAWLALGQETIRQVFEEYESSTKRRRTARHRQSKRG
jgi:metal-responsive CopG/Arc/MetJ family transcriptional regulator